MFVCLLLFVVEEDRHHRIPGKRECFINNDEQCKNNDIKSTHNDINTKNSIYIPNEITQCGFFYTNCDGLKNKVSKLQVVAEHYENCKILCITESHLNKHILDSEIREQS